VAIKGEGYDMDPGAKRTFGRVNLDVTIMGYGSAPIGNIFKPVAEEEAAAMVQGAWDAGIRYFDTAPYYGHGLSEARLGAALRWYPRDEFVLSTKVGRVLTAKPRGQVDFSPWVDGLPFALRFDYSYDGAMRSIEDSLQRLGLERIDIAFIHDCDVFTHGAKHQPGIFETAMEGAWRALDRLRSEGVVKAIGVGVNEWQVCYEALRRRDFDCFLLAGRYTLLEQESLDAFLPLCEERDVAIILGGGYNSGILATGAVQGAKYNYSPAPEPILARTRRIEEVCRAHGVSLKAAALQFVLAHPVIKTNIPGTRSVKQLQDNLKTFRQEIPVSFWADLKRRGLVRQDAPVPG
jgi:D-threo-aldose 1-dehydrogenase